MLPRVNILNEGLQDFIEDFRRRKYLFDSLLLALNVESKLHLARFLARASPLKQTQRSFQRCDRHSGDDLEPNE